MSGLEPVLDRRLRASAKLLNSPIEGERAAAAAAVSRLTAKAAEAMPEHQRLARDLLGTSHKWSSDQLTLLRQAACKREIPVDDIARLIAMGQALVRAKP